MAIAIRDFIGLLLRMKLRWRQQDAAFARPNTTGPDISAQQGLQAGKAGQ